MTDVSSPSNENTGSPQTPEYNRVFEKFVGDTENGMSDIIGIVAYGIYKNAKREWASSFRETYDRAPIAEDLKAYHATWTPAQIQSARNSAVQVMAAYADEVIAAEEPRILRDAVRGKFWPTVGTSVFANAVYTIGLILFALILARAGIDLLGVLSAAASK